MSAKTVCRLCLAMDTPVHTLSDHPLRDVFEKLTNISLTPHHPLVACLLCYSQLMKCHNLMVRSVRADKVLSQILHRGEVAPWHCIAMHRKAYHLNNPLSLTPIKLINFPDSKHLHPGNLMKTEIKEEPVQSHRTEDIEVNIPACYLKCEEWETEGSFYRVGLENEGDNESGVSIDEQDVKSKVDTNIESNNMMQKAAECIESDLSEGAVRRGRRKRIHTRTRDTTPREQDVAEKRRKLRTVAEQESTGTNTSTDVSRKTDSTVVAAQCPVYQREFSQKKSLKGHHVRTYTKEKPFECTMCPRKFTLKSALNRHWDTHNKRKRQFECAICQQRFRRSYNFKLHLTTHTKERPYECTICKQTFFFKQALYTHLRTHTKENPYECVTCQQGFIRKSHLINHMNTHEAETI